LCEKGKRKRLQARLTLSCLAPTRAGGVATGRRVAICHRSAELSEKDFAEEL